MDCKLIMVTLILGCFGEYSINAINTQAPLANPMIINGEVAKNRTEFAYTISIRKQDTKEHFCGGSIIHPKYVLTAAYCITIYTGVINKEEIFVVGGFLNVNEVSKDVVESNVTSIYPYPDYNPLSRQHDIAVLELEKLFCINNFTLSVIRAARRKPKFDTECIVSGWGATMEGGPYSSELRYSNIHIVNDIFCEYMYKDMFMEFRSGMLCAGYLRGGKGPCERDTGGPLVINQIQVGIVSHMRGCGREGIPGLYTDVSNYVTWIKEKTGVDISVSIFNKPNAIIPIFCIAYLVIF